MHQNESGRPGSAPTCQHSPSERGLAARNEIAELYQYLTFLRSQLKEVIDKGGNQVLEDELRAEITSSVKQLDYLRMFVYKGRRYGS